MRLVLEGGGSRAAYQAGVLSRLEQAGVRGKAVVGSSSGAINAAFFASGQMDHCVELWTEFVPGDRFVSWRRQFTPWGAPGLGLDDMLDNVITGRGMLDAVAATSGDPELFMTATDVDAQGCRVAHPRADNLIEWLRACMALPVGYNRLVELEGGRFIDGGISSPVCFDEDLGIGDEGPRVVVLTRPMQTSKPPPVFWERLAVRTIVPPEARASCLRQHHLHNATMKRLKAAVSRGEVLLLDPPRELPLSRLTRSKSRLERGVELGRQRGEDLLRLLEGFSSTL